MSDADSARRHATRRELLQASAAVAAGMYGLAPRYGLAADIPFQFDGSKFQLAAPEPNPKRGGVLRYGITNRLPHFDVHQSGTINNLGAQGCMFDNLIRRDPRDSGKTMGDGRATSQASSITITGIAPSMRGSWIGSSKNSRRATKFRQVYKQPAPSLCD